MVFTHLPSSIASAFVPLPSTVGWTVAILLLKAALNSMDQAPRTAFIAEVVKPEERTGVMGITSMLRTLAMSAGPTVTGILAGDDRFWAAFLTSGICRVTYDLGLWVLFINVKVNRDEGEPREEPWGQDGDEDLEGLLSDSDERSSLRLSTDDDHDVGKKV